jgi:hypothetical protein
VVLIGAAYMARAKRAVRVAGKEEAGEEETGEEETDSEQEE